MGGRFGKYGDVKRKARLRRSRALRKNIFPLKHQSKRIKPQPSNKLKVSVVVKP